MSEKLRIIYPDHHGLRKASISTTSISNFPAHIKQLDESDKIEDISKVREHFGELMDSDGFALDQVMIAQYCETNVE